MDNSVGAIQPSGLFQYSPTYLQNFADIDDIDMISNPYTMNSSIFGMNGMLPYSPMGGMMFDPNKSYFENMKDYQTQWNDYYVEQQKLQRNSDVKINAPMEAIRETATNLKDKILHDEQDQIQSAYKSYLNSVKNAYGEGSEEELNSRAISLYTQLNGGKSLVQDLRENGHCSFLQGYIQALTFGQYAQNSAEDNIANITHQEVPTAEKVEQNIGKVAGFGTVGLGAYGLTKLLQGNTGTVLKAMGKFFTSKAGIIATAVTAFVAATTLLTKNSSS